MTTTTSCKPVYYSFTMDNDEELPDQAFADLETIVENLIVNTYWENDGIGAYECWGYCGNDKGNDYVCIDDAESLIITVNFSIPVEDKLDLIKNILLENLNLTRMINDQEFKLKPTITISDDSAICSLDWE